MKTDFILEVVENEDLPRFLESLSGWEAVVFELEDEPDQRAAQNEISLEK